MNNEIDFIDFSTELLQTTREAIELSKEYLETRKIYSECFNKIQILLQKANIINKKSVENKIIELMNHNVYGDEAQKINEKMLETENLYKSLELVVKAYLAHASALQSVLKTQITAELNENVKSKYN